MGMLLTLIPKPLLYGALGLVAGMAVLAGVYAYAHYAGRQAAAVERLQADVNAHIKREGIDHEVDGMERYRVCLDLGGLPDQCEQLRGLDKAADGE